MAPRDPPPTPLPGLPREPPRPCPICRKPSAEAYAPFCSKRCADIDLHRWLGGVYAVPEEGPAGDPPIDEG